MESVLKDYVWLIWDLAALILVICMVRFGARQGFLRTVTSFVGGFVASVAASWLSTPLARFLYDSVVRDAIRAVVSSETADAAQKGLDATNDLLSDVPGWLRSMIPPGTLAAEMNGVADSVADMVDKAVSQPIIMLLRGVCFFILFTVFMFVVRYLVQMAGLANRLPLISPVNALLGGMLGAGQALIILYLLAAAAHIYIAISGGGNRYLSAEVLGEGYLFSFFFRLAS